MPIKDPFAEVKKKFVENDLRTIWRAMKQTALNQVQADIGSKARANLEGQFNQGLGPKLEQWADEASQLPKIKRAQLEETYEDINRIISSYRSGIKNTSIKGTKSAMILDRTLQGLKEELDRQVQWYKDVGLW